MALNTGLGLAVLTIATTVTVRILAEEITAWASFVTRLITKFSVQRLPEKFRERLQEEWQSHINDIPGNVGKFLLASGFLIAAYRIAFSEMSRDIHERRKRLLEDCDNASIMAFRVLKLLESEPRFINAAGAELIVNRLRLTLAAERNNRQKAAALYAAASVRPPSLIGNIRDLIVERRSAKYYENSSRLTNEIKQNCEKIENMHRKHFGCKKVSE